MNKFITVKHVIFAVSHYMLKTCYLKDMGKLSKTSL